MLLEAVEEQLISDVPLGSFLSGGIDSTLITALSNKIYKKKFQHLLLDLIIKNLMKQHMQKKLQNI